MRSPTFWIEGPPLLAQGIRVLSLADWSTGYYPDPKDNYSDIPKPSILP